MHKIIETRTGKIFPEIFQKGLTNASKFGTIEYTGTNVQQFQLSERNFLSGEAASSGSHRMQLFCPNLCTILQKGSRNR